MKPYPAYKESGLAWLNEIPAHWEVQKLKWLANVDLSNVDKKSKEDEPAVKLCNYTDVYYNEKITASIDFMKATASQDKIDSLTLQSGDVLITKDSESSDDIAVPAFVPETLQGVVCGYHLAHIRPNENRANGSYLFRAFSANGVRDQFEVNANGVTRFGIGKYTIENAVFVVPPVEEQQAIADYLDRKTAVIDTLIAKKERQIALLQEQKTAVINHAVTKGLNPHAPLKDSGILWLGEIPAHWTSSLIKYHLHNVTDGAHVSPETENGVYPFISTVNVDNGEIDFENCLLTSSSSYEMLKSQGCQPEKGDVLFSKDGTIGKTVLIKRNFDFVVASSLIILKPNKTSVYPGFLDYLMQSSTVVEQINSFVKGSALKRISLVNLKRIYGSFPPLEEQTEIAVFLDKRTAKIQSAVRKVEKQIELLREYRTAVISAAVTGKIDLREATL